MNNIIADLKKELIKEKQKNLNYRWVIGIGIGFVLTAIHLWIYEHVGAEISALFLIVSVSIMAGILEI